MERIYSKPKKRAPKGSGRKSKIVSIRIPEEIKIKLDNWKGAYELQLGKKITYEQMLMWWMDNIGFSDGSWDQDVREIVNANGIVNRFHDKLSIVNYLNKKGKFWEFCNKATESVPDDELILKSLLFLEFEDMPQLFALYGKERCKDIFVREILSKGEYYNKIAFMLNYYFFKTDVSE